MANLFICLFEKIEHLQVTPKITPKNNNIVQKADKYKNVEIGFYNIKTR